MSNQDEQPRSLSAARLLFMSPKLHTEVRAGVE